VHSTKNVRWSAWRTVVVPLPPPSSWSPRRGRRATTRCSASARRH